MGVLQRCRWNNTIIHITPIKRFYKHFVVYYKHDQFGDFELENVNKCTNKKEITDCELFNVSHS